MTQEILARMRETGFTTYDGGPVRYDPVEWDINNGRCDEWAGLAARRLGVGSCTMWMDPYHCVLFYQGLWYDADCVDGEADWANLPMFKDPGRERPEPLQREKRMTEPQSPSVSREEEARRADEAKRANLEQVGVDLMNAYNQGRTNPAWMAVNGHDTTTGYEFLIDHPSGEPVLVTLTRYHSIG